jgi:serine/threonine protein kinase
MLPAGEDAYHSHLIRIERVWCAGGFLVIAMELADGNLADLLDVYFTEFDTPLPSAHLLPLLAQAANALDFLNNRRHLIHGEWVTVQHCDVTVRNLLVFGKTVKLSDFGLTTTLSGRQKVHHRSGTPAYAAPEVFQGYLTNRTDQYALAVCYCLLRGGQFPFADTPPDFRSDYARPAPNLDMLAPAERPAVARALALVPEDRWPSCGDLVAALEKAIGIRL